MLNPETISCPGQNGVYRRDVHTSCTSKGSSYCLNIKASPIQRQNKKHSSKGQGSLQMNVAFFSLSCLWMKAKFLEGSTTVWLSCGEHKALVQGGIAFSTHWEKKFFTECVEVITLKGFVRQL